MTVDELAQLEKCPDFLPKPLQALWYDKHADWHRAHELVQNASGGDSAWVHGYLHRKEGDLSNARYWYGRSGKPEFQGDLNQEWQHIATELLKSLDKI